MQKISYIERLFYTGCELAYRWAAFWSKKRLNIKSMYKNISELELICITLTAGLCGVLAGIDVFYISFGICELLPIVITQEWESNIAMAAAVVALAPSFVWWYKAKFAQSYPSYKQAVLRENTSTRVLWFLLFCIISVATVILPFIVIMIVRHWHS